MRLRDTAIIMNTSVLTLLVVALVAANIPFMSNRVMLLVPVQLELAVFQYVEFKLARIAVLRVDARTEAVPLPPALIAALLVVVLPLPIS